MATGTRRAAATAANREAVLRSARQEFERSGYHGAALARIADEAGFSEGVVYSQFGSKVDLFLAVLEASIEDRAATLSAAADRADGPDDLRRVARSQLLASLAWQATLIEFRVHAWRHPEVNERYRALHEQAIQNVARLVATVLPGGPGDQRLAAVGLLAETVGIGLEVLADPALDVEGVEAALTHGALARSGGRS